MAAPQSRQKQADPDCAIGLHISNFQPKVNLTEMTQSLLINGTSVDMPKYGFPEGSVRAVSRDENGGIYFHSASVISSDSKSEIEILSTALRLQDENRSRRLKWPSSARLENIFVDVHGNLIAQTHEDGHERLRVVGSENALTFLGVPDYTIRKGLRLANGEFAFLLNIKDSFANGYVVVVLRDGKWVRPINFTRSAGREAKQLGADLIELPDGELLLATSNYDSSQYQLRASGGEHSALGAERVDLSGFRAEDARIHITTDGRVFFAMYGLTDPGSRELRVHLLGHGNKMVYHEDFPKDQFVERSGSHKWSFEGLSWHRDKNGVDSLTLERPTGDRVYSLRELNL